jgi:hypothetical protein
MISTRFQAPNRGRHGSNASASHVSRTHMDDGQGTDIEWCRPDDKEDALEARHIILPQQLEGEWIDLNLFEARY